jgi:hypothetical protein
VARLISLRFSVLAGLSVAVTEVLAFLYLHCVLEAFYPLGKCSLGFRNVGGLRKRNREAMLCIAQAYKLW